MRRDERQDEKKGFWQEWGGMKKEVKKEYGKDVERRDDDLKVNDIEKNNEEKR